MANRAAWTRSALASTAGGGAARTKRVQGPAEGTSKGDEYGITTTTRGWG